MDDQRNPPTGPHADQVRIGTPEREAAVRDLSAHLEAGRLTSVEYEDRSVRVSGARTWGDLVPIFADLPEPRPAGLAGLAAAPRPLVGAAPPVPPVASSSATPVGGVLPERWRETVVAITPILAVVLFFATGSWLWFLCIPLVGILAYGGGHRRRPRR
jgi:hypothetical protein